MDIQFGSISNSSLTAYRSSADNIFILITKDGLIIGEKMDKTFFMRFVYLGSDYIANVDIVGIDFDYFDLLSEFHNKVIHK